MNMLDYELVYTCSNSASRTSLTSSNAVQQATLFICCSLAGRYSPSFEYVVNNVSDCIPSLFPTLTVCHLKDDLDPDDGGLIIYCSLSYVVP